MSEPCRPKEPPLAKPDRRLSTIVLTQTVLLMTFAWFASCRFWPAHVTDVMLYQQVGLRVLSGSWPYVDFPLEYPVGALIPFVLVALPTRLFGHASNDVSIACWSLFLQACLLCAVASITFYKVNRDGRSVSAARASTTRLAILLLLLSPILPFRYDFWPLAMALLGLWLAMSHRPVAAGLTLGAGAAMKLFPVALFPVFVIHWLLARNYRALGRCAGGMAFVGLLCWAPFLVKAPWAPLSFLNYHRDRGLQVESTLAGVLLLARDLLQIPVKIVFNYGAFHVDSPYATPVLTLQPWLSLGVYVTVLGITWRALRRSAAIPELQHRALLLATCCTLLAVVVTAKVFSTQFVVWVLPALALMPGRSFGLAILAVVLTCVVYPLDLANYVVMPGSKVIALNVRNLILVWILIRLLRELYALRPSPRQTVAQATPSTEVPRLQQTSDNSETLAD